MQVNFNPSVNQSRPNFKALKAVKFEGKVIQNCARAQKELLTIFDHPNIRKLFQNFDGEVIFKTSVIHNNPVPVNKLSFSINIFDNFSENFSKIKQEYFEKAKKAKVSSNIFEGIDFYENRPDHTLTYLYDFVAFSFDDSDILKTSQKTSKLVKEKMNNPEEYNKKLTMDIKENEQKIRSAFASVLKKEFKLRKDNIDEIQAKDDVANKLKELLGE